MKKTYYDAVEDLVSRLSVKQLHKMKKYIKELEKQRVEDEKWDEQICYMDLADELDSCDPETGVKTMKYPDDFDVKFFKPAKKFAKRHGLPWPPTDYEIASEAVRTVMRSDF